LTYENDRVPPPPPPVVSPAGEALDEAVARVRPSRVLELGTHCGYSSVRMLRLLPPGGRLVTVELDPLTAELGEEIILVAGFKHQQVPPGGRWDCFDLITLQIKDKKDNVQCSNQCPHTTFPQHLKNVQYPNITVPFPVFLFTSSVQH